VRDVQEDDKDRGKEKNGGGYLDASRQRDAEPHDAFEKRIVDGD
jgi:hypothetical protein